MLVPIAAALGLYLVYNVLYNRTLPVTKTEGAEQERESRHIGKRYRGGFNKWIRADEALDNVDSFAYNPMLVEAGETRDGNFRVDSACRYGRAPGSYLM